MANRGEEWFDDQYFKHLRETKPKAIAPPKA
jgi:hypothetical protein